MKYIVCVDWKAGYSSGFDYYPLKSDNILDAMEEAEQYINENVYLITVMEKQKGVKRVKGCPAEDLIMDYEEVHEVYNPIIRQMMIEAGMKVN